MANGELAGRGFVHELAEDLASAEQRIQAARKAGGHAPVQGGRVLREYRCGNRGATRHGAQAGMFQKGTTLHMGWLLGGNSVWDIAGDTPQMRYAADAIRRRYYTLLKIGSMRGFRGSGMRKFPARAGAGAAPAGPRPPAARVRRPRSTSVRSGWSRCA